ncbi:Trappc4 protein [Thelonectria olida]|uniref:Trappc4 protein n=1 Tax=Thelonectria olida TaxID=1576542 RepID=A0A9P8VUZ1_9HYPO|nr:Trappc4 protein [Thelonectria olida]
MAPESPSPPRRRAKRVSAQHTLERVRNNQRRHRARRKDHIATLEQKLGEAEQTISTLRGQVETLQAALARCRRQPHDQNEADSVQAFGALFDTEDLGAWELPATASTEPLVSDDQPGSEVNALISPPTESPQALIPMAQSSEFISEPPLVAESASSPAFAEAGSLLPATVTQDHILTPTTACCSNDPSSDSQPTVNATNRMALVPSQETPLLLPGYVFQSAMEAYYQANPYGEPTMLCSEAYILIAQQNFKGMNQGDVATWLWNGFRRSLQPGEGCRVNTDMLFSLLAFISDT